MDILELIQWPAMVATIAAAWLVASSKPRRRNVGFWMFLFSNALWVAWGLHVDAIALVVMQVCLAAMNIRGAFKTDTETETGADTGFTKPESPAQ